MTASKLASLDYAIHELIAKRYSPYVFEPREVEKEKLWSCFEAARWSPSSYNEQPWSFILAAREDTEGFGTLLSCLVEGNRDWAQNAGVLVLTVVSTRFQRNGQINQMALHDMGLAVAALTFQATSLGLHVHQMEGILRSKCRHEFRIPASHEPVTAFALGYAGHPIAGVNEKFRQRDQSVRERRPISEFVFQTKWGDTQKL